MQSDIDETYDLSQIANKTFKRVHFIGVGGAGMSGIALVLHERGFAVSGSDLKSSRYTRPLVRAGIDVTIGHDAATIDRVKPEIVVISSAIPDSNPELMRARELGIEVWPRAKMLSYLSQGAVTVAVAGTHGKTTTSSLAATMLDKMGESPTFLIGGVVDGYETNGHNGSGSYFVAEADESDGSFLFLDPNYVIVTNIEADHLDHYGTMQNLEATFCKLMSLVPDDGAVIVCGENPHLPELARSTGKRVYTYGFGAENDTVVTLEQGGFNRFFVKLPDGTTVHAHLDHNPGRHNALNASAVLTLGQVLGLDAQKCADAVSSFAGVHRRFELVGEVSGIRVVDDYGHHPTEIAATLAAARQLDDTKKIHVIFQPHRYSRTQALADQFGAAFTNADDVLVMDVFSAGETPIPGVSGRTVAKAIKQTDPTKQVEYIPNRHQLIDTLVSRVESGDLVITMGAGDVTLMGPSFLEALRVRADAR